MKNSNNKFEKKENFSERLRTELLRLNNLVFGEEIPVEIKHLQDFPSAPALYHFEWDKDKQMPTQESYWVNDIIENPSHILRIAVHEIRHRVQHLLDIERFDQNKVLKLEKILGVSFSHIPQNLDKNDFDAFIIDRIVESLMKRRDEISLEVIAEEIIKKDADDIILFLENFFLHN